MKIAINGFGRIGRATFKIILNKKQAGVDIDVVAINDLGSIESLAYLLKYDTVYGSYPRNVQFDESSLIVDGTKYPVYSIREPESLPWKTLDVDIVLECTGVFTKSEAAKKHLTAGAKKLILSAPGKDDGFKTVILGGEHFGSGSSSSSNSDSNFNSPVESDILSNASCTTNCVVPVLRILSQAFGVEKSIMTTVHAYTATQGLVDGPDKKDLRRGRAAAANIVPSTTGAADAVSDVIPESQGFFDGVSLRVPVICGSIIDLTAVLKRNVTVDEVNSTFMEYEKKSEFKGILKFTHEPIVSSDIIGLSYSSIVDGGLTRVVGGNLVKVMAWYDNEWGYSNRLVDLALSTSIKKL